MRKRGGVGMQVLTPSAILERMGELSNEPGGNLSSAGACKVEGQQPFENLFVAEVVGPAIGGEYGVVKPFVGQVEPGGALVVEVGEGTFGDKVLGCEGWHGLDLLGGRMGDAWGIVSWGWLHIKQKSEVGGSPERPKPTAHLALMWVYHNSRGAKRQEPGSYDRKTCVIFPNPKTESRSPKVLHRQD